MQPDQSPSDVLAQVLINMQQPLRDFQPDWVLVQGDTTTVLGAGLAAAYAGIAVGHVEAGLRTYDRANPFPEELNRVLADHLSGIHFAPTELARAAPPSVLPSFPEGAPGGDLRSLLKGGRAAKITTGEGMPE